VKIDLRILVLAGLLGGPAAAQEMAIAEELFRHYCAACHGETAEGEGEMQSYLTLPVPDLTRLSARSGGEFPMGHVIRTIDGRAKTRGHLGPMPYFAPMFARDEAAMRDDYQATVDAQGRILILAKYLEALQVPGD
jgi:mono/diheme cytochrome c family protein